MQGVRPSRDGTETGTRLGTETGDGNWDAISFRPTSGKRRGEGASLRRVALGIAHLGLPQIPARISRIGLVILWVRKRYQIPLIGFLLGRPRGRNVDSSPSREAVWFCRRSVPYG